MPGKDILAKKISIIKEIASTITSTSNLDSITNLILDLALGYTKAKSGSILLVDPSGDLVINAARGMDPQLIQSIRVKVGEYICGKVAQNRKPLLVRDIERSREIEGKRSEKYRTRSFICCPILMKDTLLGVININDKLNGKAFSNDELDLIDILASQAAVSLEEARLISALRAKAIELDERNRGLIEVDRLKTEFIATMTHEIRTPLNSIKGAVYYLKEQKSAFPGHHEFINIVSDETDKLVHLFDDLLNFSHFETRDVVFRKKLFNLQSVLNDAVSSRPVRDTLAEKNASLKIMYPDSFPEIIGDKIRLLRSFIHLIDGVSSYARAGDRIEVSARDAKNAVSVKLLLRGRKIPDKELARLFDERSLWHERERESHRMKLYLARQMIDLHHGIINAENTSRGIVISISFSKNRDEYQKAMIDELMDMILSFIAEAMNLKRCSLMLRSDVSGEFTIRSAIGIDDEIRISTRISRGERIAGLVAEQNAPLLIRDIEHDTRTNKLNDPQYNTRSLLSLPIIIDNETVGILNLNNRADGKSLNRKDLFLASVIADRIAGIIKETRGRKFSEDRYRAMKKDIEALAGAERQYQKKNGKTAEIVYSLMNQMKQNEDQVKIALYASKIYDLGMTQIDENILSKSGGLSDIEKKIIKTHPFPGVKLATALERDETVNKIILHHHERFDGAGYPDGLRGEAIPFISRVLAVVDSYTAMTSDRPYRKALSKKAALQEIRIEAGRHFDPEIVSVFARSV